MADRTASNLARVLAPLGEAARPALDLYFAAEDQMAAAGRLTIVSRQVLGIVQRTDRVLGTDAAVAAFVLGYAARLAAEAQGAGAAVSRDELPPLEYGIAGPKPSSVAARRGELAAAMDGLIGRSRELAAVPAPVWAGFERAVAARVAEQAGRAGRKIGPHVPFVVTAGYLARVLDQAYGLAPGGS